MNGARPDSVAPGRELPGFFQLRYSAVNDGCASQSQALSPGEHFSIVWRFGYD